MKQVAIRSWGNSQGIRIPKDQDETKFSIQYTLARALLNGSYGTADMDPPKLTPEVLDLIGKTQLIADASMEDRAKGIRGTRVEVILKDGGKVGETVLVPRGDPEKPLTEKDIADKLRVCAEGQADEETLRKLTEGIRAIGGTGKFMNPMEITGALKCGM